MIRYITDKGEVLTSNEYDLIEIDEVPFYKIVNKKTGKTLKWIFNNREYICVKPCFNKQQKYCALHRLVMSTLRSNHYFEGAQVNHIDEDKMNNKLSNLEWLSSKDNINHGTGIARRTKSMIGVNVNHPALSYQVIQITKSGVKVADYPSIHEAERQTGIAQSSICNCCNGQRKSAGGYVWHYKE